MAVLLVLNDRWCLQSLQQKLCQQGFDILTTSCGKIFPAWRIAIEKLMLRGETDFGFHNGPP